MLFEKIIYSDDFPINIRIMRITDYPFHYHEDVEFVYVLKGEVKLKNMCHKYLLKEGDIFTNSSHEIHGIKKTEVDNVVAIIQVSNSFFARYFPQLDMACYMTYKKNDQQLQLDTLRKILLQVLLYSTNKSYNYRNLCIDQMIEAIRYINAHFNLFGFEGDTVVAFKDQNPIVVERISNIINYVYANYTSKVTLENIALSQHLSTFYVSHIIKEYMGINFQDFLSFARAEMSERILLDTNLKISAVARETGFSTTAYFNKAFVKWFGHTPMEHRRLFTSHVLSSKRPAQYHNLSDQESIELIKPNLSSVSYKDKNTLSVNDISFSVNINPLITPIMDVSNQLEVIVTIEDYKVLKERLFYYILDLNPDKVIIELKNEKISKDASDLKELIEKIGFNVDVSHYNGIKSFTSPERDSILAGMFLIRSHFINKSNILRCRLRDQGDLNIPLKGISACINSQGIAKPLYYIYKCLHAIKGNLLFWDKNYYVFKNEDSYAFITLNYNDLMQHLHLYDSTMYEINDIINNYRNKVEVCFKFETDPGVYTVSKYSLNHSNSLFCQMAKLDFPKSLIFSPLSTEMINTAPSFQLSEIESKGIVKIVSNITGAGIEVIMVNKKDPSGYII